jgi:hypothetical protein
MNMLDTALPDIEFIFDAFKLSVTFPPVNTVHSAELCCTHAHRCVVQQQST